MRTTRMLALTLVVFASGLLAGCDSTPADRPESARPAATAPPSRGNPDVRTGTPKPDPKRLAFDPATNTLTVYDMPGAAQWMVRTDGEKSGVPIARTHRFAAPVRAETVSVFYAVPNGGTSAPVTLQDILEAHTPPVIQ